MFEGLRVTPLYNPALLPAERTRLATSLRPHLVTSLLGFLRRLGAEGAPQHQLVLGPSGAGKTMLLRTLQTEILQDAELARRWFPLTFPEAQWDIARPADLWDNALDYLVVALERRMTGGAGDLRQRIAGLPEDADRRGPTALALLVSEAKRLERRFVFLIDTLDVVLERLKRDQWEVREVLASQPEVLVIGASARAIEATYRYDAAFYDFFQLHELRPLHVELLPGLLGRLGEEEPLFRALASALAERPAVVRAAIHLVGSQPRMLALLGRAAADVPQAGAATLVQLALDGWTPVFRARVEPLAPQSLMVLHALASHWHPARPQELAARSRLAPNVVSAQLHRLVQEGIVDKVSIGARVGFLITDRVLQAWLLMRLGQPHRRRLVAAAEALAGHYESALGGGGVRDPSQRGEPAGIAGDPSRPTGDATFTSEAAWEARAQVAPELRALMGDSFEVPGLSAPDGPVGGRERGGRNL